MISTGGSSLFGGLVGLVVVVALLALVAGAALSGNDLLNPHTSEAIKQEKLLAAQSKAETEALERKLQSAQTEAELARIRQEIEARSQKEAADLEAYRAQKEAEKDKAAFDLANYKAQEAIRLQAELARLQAEIRSRERELEQNLALQHKRATQDMELARDMQAMFSVAGGLAILIVSGGLTFSMVLYSLSRWGSGRTKTRYTMVWHDPIWRAKQVQGARTIEFIERQSALIWPVPRRSTVGGNGRFPPDKLVEPQ